MANDDYGVPRADELERQAEIQGSAFAFTTSDARGWIASSGVEQQRVLREGGAVVACLMWIPMGLFFGGRSVPTWGVAGVAVAFEHRGRGAGRRLMEHAVREAAASGVATSSLYPATQTLYRLSGYERAGKVVDVALPLEALTSVRPNPADAAFTARPLTDADASAVAVLYTETARRAEGCVDRGAYVWKRVRAPRGVVAQGIGVFTGDRLDGYFYLLQRSRANDPQHDVALTDLAARGPAAMRALLVLLRQHRSVAKQLTFRGGPSEPWLSLLDEPRAVETTSIDWMLRVTHVEAALAARGYREGLTTHLELEVTDPLVEANQGRFTLRIEGGRGVVSRGGAGSAKLEVRALAPLFTGHHTASALARLGWLDAAESELTRLDAVFAGPTPAMRDMF